MTRLFPLALVGLLAACSTTAPPSPQVAANDGADMRCEKVYPTGSNMPKTVCTTAEDRRRQQAEVDQVTEKLRQAPSVPMQRNPM